MKVVMVKKAEKGQPYVWLQRADGREELKCGTISQFQETHDLIRINRGYAVCLSIIAEVKGNNAILTSGENLRISRRKLQSFRHAAAAH
ncbi:LytTR family transcriptional regulator DNA-binding domain-containing protein [Jiulongibacter sp. NS-SX5]|uniref:LytTR family transcriptional regulator DNA-binding domain-containing protein n=1 Tax=Jiulongibacter sp. NS-SX5 TaxID=3463854 RepID=UPI004058FA25